MNKIILVFIALLVISCTNSTTNPNTNIYIGDGTVIDEVITDNPPLTNQVITDPIKISDYLKKGAVLDNLNLLKFKYETQ